ncbi:MAG: two-component sensor histidine kinase, partial [Rhizobiales bacterium]|nr:two-component sensor histidine kinase [Hyphomicrobiales bacterium]
MAATVETPVPAPTVVRAGWRRITRLFGDIMPKGLYARSLIIIITPVVLLQAFIAFVFMEEHFRTVTARLSAAVVADIAAIIDIKNSYPQDADLTELTRIARQRLGLTISIMPGETLPPASARPFFSQLDQALSAEITRKIN